MFLAKDGVVSGFHVNRFDGNANADLLASDVGVDSFEPEGFLFTLVAYYCERCIDAGVLAHCFVLLCSATHGTREPKAFKQHHLSRPRNENTFFQSAAFEEIPQVIPNRHS